MNLLSWKNLPLLVALFSVSACGDNFENVDLGEFRCVEQNAPCEVNFGRLDMNRPGQTAKVEVTNVGEGDLEIRSVRMEGASPLMRFSDTTTIDFFNQAGWTTDTSREFNTNGDPIILPPNARLEIELQFDPDGNDPLCPGGVAGTDAQCGSVIIESNDIDADEATVIAPIRVTVGDSRMEITPSVISFSPAQLLDAASGTYAEQQRSFLVKNLGTGNMTIISINPDNPELVITDENGADPVATTIFGGGERTYNVTWEPTSEEPLDARLTVVSDASAGGTRILIANSEGQEDAAIEVEPCDFFFGETAVGETAESLFDVTNVGSAPMTWSVTLSGVRPTSARGDFTILSGTDQNAMGEQDNLDPDQTSTLKLVYTPTEVQSVTGGVSFRGNFGTSFECPFAAGEAVAVAEVAPVTLFWSGIGEGESDVRTFVVSNIGRADLDVSSIDIGGERPDEYSVDALVAGGFSLAPGEARRIEVTYTRDVDDVPAQDDATLTVNHNGTGGGISQVFLTALHGEEFLAPSCDLSIEPPEPYDIGEVATLDASGSTLNAGEWATNQFQWTLTRPDGSSASLSSAFGPSVTLEFDVAGTYSVALLATAIVGGESTQCEIVRNLQAQ